MELIESANVLEHDALMVAAVWHGRADVRLERVSLPVPARDEAVIRVEWVGLCGSDLEEYVDGPVVARAGTILGHEIVGVVDAAAADGTGPVAGSRVVVDVVVGCGSCWWCLRHEEGLCPQLTVLGQHRDGGLAEYMVARAERLIVLPDGLDSQYAALAEPLAVAIRAFRNVDSPVGASVVILGGGTIGMLSAQVARESGASQVIVVEPSEFRRRLVGAWSIPTVWEDTEQARRIALDRLLPSRGADIVLECSGRAGVLAEGVRMVRRGGTALALGVPTQLEQIDLLDVVLGEKRVHGSAAHMWDDDVIPAVGMLSAGRIDVAPLVSAVYPLREARAAFDAMASGTDGMVKILVDCRREDVAGGADVSQHRP